MVLIHVLSVLFLRIKEAVLLHRFALDAPEAMAVGAIFVFAIQVPGLGHAALLVKLRLIFQYVLFEELDTSVLFFFVVEAGIAEAGNDSFDSCLLIFLHLLCIFLRFVREPSSPHIIHKFIFSCCFVYQDSEALLLPLQSLEGLL